MAQIFDAPSKAILRSQIAEHIAETDKNDKRELQAGEEPLPNDRFFDRELSWLKFNKRVLELAQDEDLPVIERASFAAIFAIGKPVAFDASADERLTRGFISMTIMRPVSGCVANWIFDPPVSTPI